MTIPVEILAPLVEQIRLWRKEGQPVSEIFARLWPMQDRIDLQKYLRAAFCTERLPSYELLPQQADGAPRADALDAMLGPKIEAARPVWEIAPPYPDLYRRADRHAFRAVAAAYQARVLVGAVDYRMAHLVGKPGYRPCPPIPLAFFRTAPPNLGLLTADESDPLLNGYLKEARLSYAGYCAQLDKLGFTILGQESGFLVQDQRGTSFYPGYRLQGIYSAEKGENLWRGSRAEEIRFELNQRLGEDLVQYGPQDLWEQRPQAGYGALPLTPLLTFEPDGNVDVRPTVASVRAYYGYRYLPFERIYGKAE